MTKKNSSQSLVGKSHWWGAPDLPANYPYPYVTIQGEEEEYDEPLTFVCQIRCEDIAELDTENWLPHQGMLYFFAPLDYFLGEYDSPLDYHMAPRVLYTPDITHLKPYEITWEGTQESIFRPAEEIIFSQAEEPSGDGILMLGTPYQEEVEEQHKGDICLMQMDENDDWNLRFYDCGMYYIFMSREDLQLQKWEKATSELFFY